MGVPCRAILAGLIVWFGIGISASAMATDIYATANQFTDERGAVVTLAQWQGQSNIITFAYSTCRKVCVETLHVLERLQREADLAKRDVNFFVVSYDPASDTPQVWADYRERHALNRPNWHFLLGSEQATRALATSLNFEYWLYDEHVMHDFRIVLIDKQGNFEKVMSWKNRDERWF